MTSVKARPPEAGLSTRAHPHLGVLLERGRRLLNQAMLERFRASGFGELREAHGPLFAFLPANGARVTELAERARVTKQSMGELVTELEHLGYVERTVDPRDGRAKLVRFTPKGRRAAKIGVQAVAAQERAWADLIGAERVADLRRTLEEVTAPRPPPRAIRGRDDDSTRRPAPGRPAQGRCRRGRRQGRPVR